MDAIFTSSALNAIQELEIWERNLRPLDAMDRFRFYGRTFKFVKMILQRYLSEYIWKSSDLTCFLKSHF